MKTFRVVMCLISLVLLLAGCGTASSQAGEKEHITLWYWNRGLDDSLVEQIETQFPNVELEAQKIGGDFRIKLQTTLVGNSGGPDIVMLNDWIAQYLPYNEHFANLYDYGAESIQDDYLDWKWNLAEVNDGEKLIALPVDTGPTALFYRKDLFEQAGLPTEPEEVASQLQTWDQYIEAGKKLKESTGVYMVDSILSIYRMAIAQSPKKFFSEDDEYIGDQDHMKQIWDTAVKAAETGIAPGIQDGTTDWNAAYNNSQIATVPNAVWGKKILEDAAPNTSGQWRVAEAPGGAGNRGGSFLSVLESSEHKQTSYDIIAWLMSPENQITAYQNYNLFPSAIDALESSELSSEEEFYGGQNTTKTFVDVAKDVPETYFGEFHSMVNGIFEAELRLVETRGKDPEQAWNDIQVQVKRELSRR
ncbi:ABC transporter substrate-binding protein [Aureibacillus halotolerans]|uniref:Carbohydrate ABC transporter substrate-binding protein (CUT1 family) n=1 Tax=Aureibacillus halotolerans TaxID=1508390 RepID=A0A4V3D601_9BACI|nr:extracellular solute-binding protein [Aureibacillus halotolerans]TDQ41997.1 carbohydrate ABC transporter substrate-binding protein (CUT1 family) [Aureibacillus halotolerans]